MIPDVRLHQPDPHYFRRLRVLSGWTQQAIARLLGVTDRTISRYETAGTFDYPTQFLLERIARFETSINEHDGLDQIQRKVERSLCDYIGERLAWRDQPVRVAHTLFLSRRATVAEAIAAGERHAAQPGVAP